MNISSILITIVGIIIILALYVASRLGQSNLPKNESSEIPDIKDEKGEKFTSVLDDIPATDGSASVSKETKSQVTINKQQIVLFISGNNEEKLDGLLIKKTLINNGLKLGDKDIYHYFLESDKQVYSLFRVANGVEPWTLKEDDLNNNILGLSMVMLLPNNLEKKEAISIFIEKAENITTQVNGVLKNQQQKELSTSDKEAMYKL